MKELSIEEKAEAYDNAFERAKFYKENTDKVGAKDVSNLIEEIFPELKDNEDVRMKNFISNELVCIRATDEKGSDRYNELTEAIVWLEKQGEQKFADKVEPKFHEGDWITNGKCTWKVWQVCNLDYILQNQWGHRVKDTIDYVNKEFHLWYIQDAKDGDVLAAYECLVLFKEIDGLNIKCHCTYNFMNNPSFYVNTLQNKSAFHTATKEQRDLLFQKIKEAGYEWNAKKKELKKIEDESENYKQQVMDETTDSVKDCISQEFAEWSEEDENILEAYSRYR